MLIKGAPKTVWAKGPYIACKALTHQESQTCARLGFDGMPGHVIDTAVDRRVRRVEPFPSPTVPGCRN